MKLDVIKEILQPMIEAQDDPKNKRHVAASAFGMFPRMAMAALGANLSASFPERINSAAKLILTPGRSGLPDLCLERCVILRINKKFIYHMKEKWPRQPGTGRLVMTAAQQKCFDKIAVEKRSQSIF